MTEESTDWEVATETGTQEEHSDMEGMRGAEETMVEATSEETETTVSEEEETAENVSEGVDEATKLEWTTQWVTLEAEDALGFGRTR